MALSTIEQLNAEMIAELSTIGKLPPLLQIGAARRLASLSVQATGALLDELHALQARLDKLERGESCR